MSFFTKSTTAVLAASTLMAGSAFADDAKELNLYSSRHYDTDERLYSDFSEATGITINRIEDKADEKICWPACRPRVRIRRPMFC